MDEYLDPPTLTLLRLHSVLLFPSEINFKKKGEGNIAPTPSENDKLTPNTSYRYVSILFFN